MQFLLKRDPKGVFQFASIQGEPGRELLTKARLQVSGLETLLLVDGANTWQHTDAIFRVLSAWDGRGRPPG